MRNIAFLIPASAASICATLDAQANPRLEDVGIVRALATKEDGGRPILRVTPPSESPAGAELFAAAEAASLSRVGAKDLLLPTPCPGSRSPPVSLNPRSLVRSDVRLAGRILPAGPEPLPSSKPRWASGVGWPPRDLPRWRRRPFVEEDRDVPRPFFRLLDSELELLRARLRRSRSRRSLRFWSRFRRRSLE